MPDWINVTMHRGAFLMWGSFTTTLTVFHIFTHFQSINTDTAFEIYIADTPFDPNMSSQMET